MGKSKDESGADENAAEDVGSPVDARNEATDNGDEHKDVEEEADELGVLEL